jgi:hypothetical protein
MNHPTYFAIISVPKLTSRSFLPCRFPFTAILISCLAISPMARAVTPAPDGGYTGANTAEGQDALFSLTTGSSNTAIGFQALLSNTTGGANTANGNSALLENTTGGGNTATGASALSSNSGDQNTATGINALSRNTTANNNTADGAVALADNTTGADNTADGAFALANNTTASNNTATGFDALFTNTTGFNNTASGVSALLTNTNGFNNTATGFTALQNNTSGNSNTAAGDGALAGNTTGSNNIAVGINAGLNLTTGSNNIDIGAPGVAAESNTTRIGKQGTQKKTFIAGIRGVTVASGVGVIVGTSGQLGTVVSSARFKEAINPMDKTSEAIHRLQPVTFRYKEELDPDKIPQFGLIAEEVEKINPDLVARDEDGKVMTVRYEAVNAMLLNEFLKEHQKVEEQGAIIAQMKKQIETLAATVRKVRERVELRAPPPQIAANED